MKFNIKSIFILVALLYSVAGMGQEVLTLKNAIDTALNNNFDIQIAKNNVNISKKNNTLGMAGGLPNISASVGDNLSITGSNQKFNDGTESTVINKGENAINAGVSAGILLFNGFKITATKERLNRLQNLSEIQLNQQIQRIIADIMVTYYDIIRQQNYLRIIQNSLDVSKQKLEIINVKKEVGMADGVLTLQAQADLNSSEQTLESQKLLIQQNKADLLLLINSKQNITFLINDSIIIDQTLQLEPILNFLNRNTQYLSAEQQILINEQILKEVSALRYPSVKLSAGYDFYHANLNTGSMTMNQNFGPTAGISMQIPILNGNIYKTQKEVAKISITNSEIEKESLKNSLTTQATKLYRSYSTTLQQIENQKKNYEMTKQLVDIVLQKFHVNQSTILDVKAAQTSFENAAYLLINLQYSAKVAEIELKQLIYNLAY